MTAPDEDLVQQLSSALGKVLHDLSVQRNEPFYLAGGLWHFQLNTDEKDDDLPRLARAVLASGLLIPAEPVRQVADRYDGKRTNGSQVANRLRAILGDPQHDRTEL